MTSVTSDNMRGVSVISGSLRELYRLAAELTRLSTDRGQLEYSCTVSGSNATCVDITNTPRSQGTVSVRAVHHFVGKYV